MASFLEEIHFPESARLEHQVAVILQEQEQYGWAFREKDAYVLLSQLQTELDEISERCRLRHPFISLGEFTPKVNNSTRGYVKECTFTKISEFNPTSRDHISWVMKEFNGWIPNKFTDNGKPSIDEVVLKDIGTEEALDYFRALELTKAIGMLSKGVNAWLKLVKKGRLHHHCSMATITGRMAHRKPNLAQVPVEPEFRRLFSASPGMVMVGADLSGIELRMLAHYLARYDDGRYGDILINGDIHQENADKIGISRRLVKTVTYAFLYGAGDMKIGFSYDPQLSETAAKKKGKEIRTAYMDAIPGLKNLVNAVKEVAQTRQSIRAIDGRAIPCDGPHKALNYLLQSSAGVIAKRWMVLAYENFGPLEARQLAFVHDEIQTETKPVFVDQLKANLELSAIKAGEYYNLRCPIAAESKSGQDWSEVH